MTYPSFESKGRLACLLCRRLGSTSSLRPHLNRLHRHSPLVAFTPCRQPLILRGPELLGGGDTFVAPGLVGETVFEEAIGGADGDVEDQVEWLVERRLVTTSLAPWIV